MFKVNVNFVVAYSAESDILFVSTSPQTAEEMRDRMQKQHSEKLNVYVRRTEMKLIS